MQLIANFVPGRRGVTEEEAAAWLADLQDLGARGEYFFSINRYLFLARRIDHREISPPGRRVTAVSDITMSRPTNGAQKNVHPSAPSHSSEFGPDVRGVLTRRSDASC